MKPSASGGPTSQESSDQRHQDAARPTARSAGAWLTLAISFGLGLFLDLWTKSLAFARVAGAPVRVDRADVLATTNLQDLIPRHDPVVVFPSMLEFTLVLNPGAVFGVGAGQRWLFVAFTGVAVVMGMWMFLKWTTPRDRIAHACLGLVLSGGIGNLYDRLVFACVRDFIHPLPGAKVAGREIWPYVSNVADAFLIIGIAGLMWFLWQSPEGQAKPAPDATASSESDN